MKLSRNCIPAGLVILGSIAVAMAQETTVGIATLPNGSAIQQVQGSTLQGGPALQVAPGPSTANVQQFSAPAQTAPVQQYVGPAQQPVVDLTPVQNGGAIPSELAPGPMAASYGVAGQMAPQVDLGSLVGYQPFGPQVTFDANLDDGLAYSGNYYRVGAMIPMHLVTNQDILFLDVSGSVTEEGDGLFNLGGGRRVYSQEYDRVFGVNGYFDLGSGRTNQDIYRAGVGFESLGKYLDFRANGYIIVGDESFLVSDTYRDGCTFEGHNVLRTRDVVTESAFSGFDVEVGGPLPFVGAYGLNGYVGGYWLDSEELGDTTGYSLRAEALVTESVSVNFTHTHDNIFDETSYVNIAVTFPRWRAHRFMRPRIVKERLMDRVWRHDRIHSQIGTATSTELARDEFGDIIDIAYIDPDATTPGTGTLESPFESLEAFFNDGRFDIIRVDPRDDGTGTNLTIDGGLSLFDSQVLLSGHKSYELFEGCVIAPSLGATAAPIIQDPTITAGESVIRLANGNSVIGFTIDASNSTGTDNGFGIANPFAIRDTNISMNTFENYTIATNLIDVSGHIQVEDNVMTGSTPSTHGLVLNTSGGSVTDLSLQRNTATGNSVAGYEVVATAGSTIYADDPDSVLSDRVSAIRDNVATGNGIGIDLLADTGATFQAIIEGNTASNNTADGLRATAASGAFILPSVASNTFNNNGANGAFFRYSGTGTFSVVSEDANGNGILDEDSLTTEDANGNGILDLGFVSNTLLGNGDTGLCIIGDDTGMGVFDIGRPDIGSPDSALANVFAGNTNAGIAVDLANEATAQFDIVNNQITGANAGLSFLIDGDTFSDPFSVTNTATVASITRFELDTTPAGIIWDSTDDVPGTASTAFQPVAPSDITTGLVSVNGTNITAGTDPLQDAGGTVLAGGGVPDGQGVIDLVFNDFGPGESFEWNLDADDIGIPDSAVTGNELIDTTISLSFSNGAEVSGALQAVAGNPDASQFVATSGISLGDGIRVTATDTARVLPSTIVNNNIADNGARGIHFNMSSAARTEGLDIKANTVTQNGSEGIRLVANGSDAFIDASTTIGGDGTITLGTTDVDESNSITNNGGDGLQALALDGGTVFGNAFNNTITGNAGNGIALLVASEGEVDFGDPGSNRVISGNTITGNTLAGVLLQTDIDAAGSAVLDATLTGNTISQNAGGGVVGELNGATTTPGANALLLELDGSNSIERNSDVGVALTANGNSQANLVLDGVTIANTNNGAGSFDGDGIAIVRTSESLVTASITDSSVTENAGDGLTVVVQGEAPTAVAQPMSGTPNSVTFNGSTFNENGGDGVSLATQDDAVLVANGKGNTISENSGNGIGVTAADASAFGDPSGPTVSVFDSNVITSNGGDGVLLSATDTATILADVTATDGMGPPVPTSAHGGALAISPDTDISGNTGNGVHVTSAGSSAVTSNIDSGTGLTLIDNNGGDGVLVEVADSSDSTVSVDGVRITRNNNGVAYDVNGTPGTAELTVNDNIIQSNTADGVNIAIAGTSSTSQPNISVTNNTIGGLSDGVGAGNGDDGISMTVNGGTGALVLDATAEGPMVTALFEGNLISRNADRGAEVLLNGATGERSRADSTSPVFDVNSITFNDNEISSNGSEGLVFRSDADFNQNRSVAVTALNDNLDVALLALNTPTVDAQTAYLQTLFGSDSFLNLETSQNSLFTVTGNRIQNNGTTSATADGLVIDVGTNTYVAADVQDNVFSGNGGDDFSTSSFLSAADPLATFGTTMVLDDTAQLDLRFLGNEGTSINASSAGASYGFDAGKASAGLTRFAALFQVHDIDPPAFGVGSDLLNTTNDFGALNIQGAFSPNFNLRDTDLNPYPYIGFAPFQP